jgi:hypothetical protein
MEITDGASPEIESKFEYVIFSNQIGVISQHSTATDAVSSLFKYLRETPGVNAAIYRRVMDRWRIF